MTSRRPRALSIVINFLVFWSISLKSSFVHFGHKYVEKGLPKCAVLWWNFWKRLWFREVFLLVLFSSFYFISTYLTVFTCNIPKFTSFQVFWFFLPLFPFSHFFFFYLRGTFYMLNSNPISWPYILIISFIVTSSFSFFANNFISFMYIRRLIFSLDFLCPS